MERDVGMGVILRLLDPRSGVAGKLGKGFLRLVILILLRISCVSDLGGGGIAYEFDEWTIMIIKRQ